MLDQSAVKLAGMIRNRKISSVELMRAHLRQIEQVNPEIKAVVDLLSESALREAAGADAMLASGAECGPLHGVPFSIKDSIDVKGTRCTAGTLGRRLVAPASEDAALVKRLRDAGAIPLAKTNLPDLLFAYESDNLIYGRTNNPYDLTRTAGGSSGGEAALIAACGSPLGLGSDAAGSVRVPAAFCGIASIKPTSGRLPRTGHVPPAGGWAEALWQIGPMARRTEDLALAMRLLSGPDGRDFTCPPVPLEDSRLPKRARIAFFTNNGFAPCTDEVVTVVKTCAHHLEELGMIVEERRPPGVENAFAVELALLGADGADGIDRYLQDAGSTQVHSLLEAFVSHMRPYRATATEFAGLWAKWDIYRAQLARFFDEFDAVICPVYTQPALLHGGSLDEENFRGFSYTMAWNVGGNPAATVRCAELNRLPINVQIVTKKWADLLALKLCALIEQAFGGWQPSTIEAIGRAAPASGGVFV